MKYVLNTEAEAVAAFKNWLEEMPVMVGDTKVSDIETYADLDYDALNQHWADWLDMYIADGNAPKEATEWDWE
ncbi:hypothetical protein [Vibrio phage V-YDF132]|nr:hypothetical protein [Vibrio phage V-YDF132]